MEGASFLVDDNFTTEGSTIVPTRIIKYPHAEIAGFNVDCRRRLRVISICGRKIPHNFLGKTFAMPDRISKKWALNMRTVHSAALWR